MSKQANKLSHQKRALLFSIGPADLQVDTFRCGGHGGQNVNKRDTGVRIVHKESGATGQSCDERTQLQNKKIAFNRMVESDTFKKWHKRKVAELMGLIAKAKEETNKAMNPRNIKIEVQANGKWVEVTEEELQGEME